MKGKNILRIVFMLFLSGLLIMSCSKKDDPKPDEPSTENPGNQGNGDKNPTQGGDNGNTSQGGSNNNTDNPTQGGDNGNTDTPTQGGDSGNTDTPTQGGDSGNTDTPTQGGDSGNTDTPTQGGDNGNTDTPTQGGDSGNTDNPTQGGGNDNPSQGGGNDTPGTDPSEPGKDDPTTPGKDPETPVDVKYTVSYDAAGGNNAPAPVEVLKGESVTLDNGSSLSRDKFEFKGWKGSDGNTYNAGDQVVVNGDLTFTAVWEAILQQFSVTYDVNGGKGTVPGSQKVNENSSVSLFDGSSLSMVDYLFDGWQGSDGNTYKAGASFTVTGDITFKAIWKQNFALNFNGNGYTGNLPQSVKFNNGKAVVPAASLERKGYEFLGWSLNRDSRTPDFTAGSTVTSNDGSVTVFAVWKAEKFTYTFCWNFTNTKSKKYFEFSGKDIENGKASFSNVNYVYLPDGHVFVGWKADDSDKIYSENDLFDVLADRTFYPVSAPKAEANQMESWIINKY